MSHETNEGQESNPVTSGSHGEVSNPKFEAASEPSESESGQAKAVSPQKLAANRANAARHSTGPKTPEGKEKSKQNSRKHGFFARQPLPRGEEGDKLWQAYSDLVAGIWEHYQPVGYMEGLLTEKIIAESIRFSRLLTYEAKDVAEDRAFHWQGMTASSASKVPSTASCSKRCTSWSVCKTNAKRKRSHRTTLTKCQTRKAMSQPPRARQPLHPVPTCQIAKRTQLRQTQGSWILQRYGAEIAERSQLPARVAQKRKTECSKA